MILQVWNISFLIRFLKLCHRKNRSFGILMLMRLELLLLSSLFIFLSDRLIITVLFIIGYSGEIGFIGESTGTGGDSEAGAAKSGQNLWEVLVYMAG